MTRSVVFRVNVAGGRTEPVAATAIFKILYERLASKTGEPRTLVSIGDVAVWSAMPADVTEFAVRLVGQTNVTTAAIADSNNSIFMNYLASLRILKSRPK